MISLEVFLEESLMQSSVKSYLYDIEKYKKNNRNAEKYDYQKVMQYIEILRNENSVSNVKRVIASIKKYYDYLIGLKPKRIIFNPGTENTELETLAQAKGIETIEACTLVLLSIGEY